MVRFFTGALLAIVIGFAIYVAHAFQFFATPTPLSCHQFGLEMDKSRGDSHGKWMLVKRTSRKSVFELRYPIRRYFFSVDSQCIAFQKEPPELPQRVDVEAARKVPDSTSLPMRINLGPLPGSGDRGDQSASDHVCRRRTGAIGGVSYCRVSMFELMADPEKYYGRPISSIGFLLSEGGEFYAFAPTPDVFRIGDFMSCVRVPVSGAKIADDEGVSSLDKAIYSVEVAGRFEPHSSDWCVGQIQNAVISRVALVERQE